MKVKLKTKHIIRFEQGLILLDQNIQYLIFNFRGQLYNTSTRTLHGNTILNIDGLKRDCLNNMARGNPSSMEKVDKEDPASTSKVVFDVLTLRQLRLQTLLKELEERRTPTWVKREISKERSLRA